MKVHCTFTELRPVESLVENPRNPNKHTPRQIELLAKLLGYHGWRHPITVSKRSGFIITGHARLAAAKLNGWEKVPVDVQDYENEADEFAHMVADNKIQELSFNDDSFMLQNLKELELEDLDFDLLAMPDLSFDNVDEVELPDLPSGDRAPFQQMTFTLHDEQVEQVKAAMEIAKGMGRFESENENSNGNALARVCETFLTQNG